MLATANAASGVREGIDFFPLTVDVEERAYAAGKIPGAFFRREGRPSEQAILTCRLIDRPLRPSFPDGFRNETQVVITVIGADQENPHDVLAINAASAALMLSGIPFDGPIGAVRVAYSQDGTWIPHPTYAEGDASTFELVVAGRELADGDVAIMMVEAGGSEKARRRTTRPAPRRSPRRSSPRVSRRRRPGSRRASRSSASWWPRPGVREPMAYTPVLDYGDDAEGRRGGQGHPGAGQGRHHRPQGRSQRRHRRGHRRRHGRAGRHRRRARRRSPGQEKEIKEAMRSLTKKLVRKRIVEDGVRIDGRGVRGPAAAVGRGGRAAHGARLGPVPAG